MTAGMHYEVVTPEGATQRSVPMGISVLGDFSADGAASSLADRSFVDGQNLDQAIAALTPSLRLRVDNLLPGFEGESLDVDVRFLCLEDFEPDRVLRRVPTLLTLLEQRASCPEDMMQEWDNAMSRQLAAIMHHPRFQRLESTWRGLALLLSHVSSETDLRVRLLAVSPKELVDEASKGDLNQSLLLDKLEAEDYPPSCLVVDHFFGRHPQDMLVLSHLAEVGSLSSAFVAAAAAPHLLGQESWEEVIKLSSGRLEKAMQGPQYAKWSSLRGNEDSRNLALLAPGVVARPVYGESGLGGAGFVFDETALATLDPFNKHLCLNPAYLLACQIAECYRRTGWLAEIRASSPAGWINEELPWRECPTDEKRMRRLPLQAGVSDPGTVAAWSELGLVPVFYDRGTEHVSLGKLRSVHQSARLDSDEANEFMRLTSLISCGLIVARLSHFLQAIVQGGASGDCVTQVQGWLDHYTSSSRPSTIDSGAPLAEASVSIEQSREWGRLVQVRMKPWLEGGELPGPVQISIPIRF